jgi:haloacetate dehalogenase
MVSLGIEGFDYRTVGVWRSWADEVDGGPIRCGHFIPEEAAEELSASLIRFLAAS